MWPLLYCPRCGDRLPASEDVALQVCPSCGERHRRRPVVGVAVVLMEEGKVLLGRRRAGEWCIPCGHLEWGESIDEAACREFLEETGLRVSLKGIRHVQSNFHDPEHLSVGIWFDGQRTGGVLGAADDLVEVGFFDPSGPPPLAFPTDLVVLSQIAQGGKSV